MFNDRHAHTHTRTHVTVWYSTYNRYAWGAKAILRQVAYCVQVTAALGMLLPVVFPKQSSATWTKLGRSMATLPVLSSRQGSSCDMVYMYVLKHLTGPQACCQGASGPFLNTWTQTTPVSWTWVRQALTSRKFGLFCTLTAWIIRKARLTRCGNAWASCSTLDIFGRKFREWFWNAGCRILIFEVSPRHNSTWQAGDAGVSSMPWDNMDMKHSALWRHLSKHGPCWTKIPPVVWNS